MTSAIGLPTSAGDIGRQDAAGSAEIARMPSSVRPSDPATVASTMKNGNSVSSDR